MSSILGIKNPYKMNWKVGTKAIYQKAPTFKKGTWVKQDQIKQSDLEEQIEYGEVVTIHSVGSSIVPYAEVITEGNDIILIDLRNLRKL